MTKVQGPYRHPPLDAVELWYFLALSRCDRTHRVCQHYPCFELEFQPLISEADHLHQGGQRKSRRIISQVDSISSDQRIAEAATPRSFESVTVSTEHTTTQEWQASTQEMPDSHVQMNGSIVHAIMNRCDGTTDECVNHDADVDIGEGSPLCELMLKQVSLQIGRCSIIFTVAFAAPGVDSISLLHLQQEKTKIIYARVSSNHQKEDLQRQIQDLQTAYPTHKLIRDIGSGLNYKRKGFQRLLEFVHQGTVEEIVVTHKDRLSDMESSCSNGYLQRLGQNSWFTAESIKKTIHLENLQTISLPFATSSSQEITGEEHPTTENDDEDKKQKQKLPAGKVKKIRLFPTKQQKQTLVLAGRRG